MVRTAIASLLRRGIIALFPVAGVLASPQLARADAGAEFDIVAAPAGLDESVDRVYAVTREDMDYMGVSKITFFQISEARSTLDIIRGLIAKHSPAGDVSLDSWCKDQGGPVAQGVNTCARHLLRKHSTRRFSAFAASLISAIDPARTDFHDLEGDCLAMSRVPADWLGEDYLEITVTSDYYSVDVMISLMMSRDLKRAVLAFYDFGA